MSPINLQRMSYPPGISDVVDLKADDETLATFLELREQFGNVVSMKSPRGRDVWFVNDPELVHQILVRDHDRFVKGPGFERVKLLLGNGIFVSDGAHWRRARRMAQPGFTRRKLKGLIDLVCDRVAARADAWQAMTDRGASLDVTTETSDFALELILRAIFGSDYDDRIVVNGDNPFGFLAEEFSRDINLVVKFRALRDLILDIVAERRARNDEDTVDFLSVYLAARDKDGGGFSDRDLLDEIMTLIIAGFETSAGTLNWAWYLVATHPDVAAGIIEEAGRVIGDPAAPTNEELAELVFLERVINETMRLYPPGWVFSRRSLEATRLGEYDAAAGTDLYISPYILHRTADFWPDADRFDPGRFEPDRFGERQQRAFIPFSLGPRRCIGEYFAMLEMKIHLARLVPLFRMTPTSDHVPDLDLGINLRSKGSIALSIERRDV